jgi:hypothetical protein
MSLKKRDALALWLAGSGIDEPKTQAILDDPRVKHVLANAPTDGVWLMEVLNSAGAQYGVNPVNRSNPHEVLLFLGVCDAA